MFQKVAPSLFHADGVSGHVKIAKKSLFSRDNKLLIALSYIEWSTWRWKSLIHMITNCENKEIKYHIQGGWKLYWISSVSGRGGESNGAMPPLSVKISHKKMAAERGGLYFMIVGPPSSKFLDPLLWIRQDSHIIDTIYLWNISNLVLCPHLRNLL